MLGAFGLAGPAVWAADTDPPTADFTWSPSSPVTGESVTFTSTSFDTQGSIVSTTWDFDGNGTTDASGENVSHSFADNGTPNVTLTVTDDDGDKRSASRQLTVNNRPPQASFTYAPAEPFAGDEVVLSSTSTDPDGSVAEERWDLDGDGQFDDATGPEARTTFAAGTHTVALEVVDDDGRAGAPAFDSIGIDERPAPAPPDPPSGGSGTGGPAATAPTATALVAPRLLAPFPAVRVRGVATVTGVRIDLLSVRITSGTRIVVRCRGRDCPFSRGFQTHRFSGGGVRTFRIKGFKRRKLRAGTILEIFVIKRGMIGKYTRLKFRKLKPPKRVDRCTAVGAARAQRCPAG